MHVWMNVLTGNLLLDEFGPECDFFVNFEYIGEF
jgi:hypothetical protein